VDNLTYPANFLEKGRFPLFKENLKLLKKKVGEELAMFGESEGAFTCAATCWNRMFEMVYENRMLFRRFRGTKQ
jgi:uroporphyrinogen-III decarboxylase